MLNQGRGWAWLALLFIAAAALFLRPYTSSDSVNAGLWLWLAGGLLLGLAFRRSPMVFPAAFSHAAINAYRSDQPQESRPMIAAGSLALLLLAEINGQKLGLAPLLSVSYHIQFALLFVGCLLLGLGFSGPAITLSMVDIRSAFRSGWPIIAVTLLSLSVNGWQIGSAVHIWIDEFHFADTIVRLWRNPYHLLLPANPGIAAFTSIYGYLQSLSAAVFGADLVGLRAVSAVLGALVPPALYLLGKALFDRRTALLAALLLATFPPHIHFSRLGLNNIADPLLGVLALALFVYGLRSGQRGAYAFAGVLLGLTQYFYEGGKLLYPVLFISSLGLLAVTGRVGIVWRGLAVMGFTALMTALPVYYLLLGTSAPIMPRLTEMNIFEAYFSPERVSGISDFFEKSLKPPLLHLVHIPDESHFFYGGDTALLLVYAAPAFMAGVFTALWRLRLAGALLLLWVGAALVGNSLIVQSTWTARYVVTFPALALLTACGLRWTLLLLAPVSWLDEEQRRSGLRRILSAAAALAFALPQIGYYFGPHLSRYNQQVRPYLDHIDVYYRARLLSPAARIIIIHTSPNIVYTPHYESLAAFWNFWPSVEVLPASPITYDLVASLPPTNDYAFFVEPDDRATADILGRHFTLLPGRYSPFNVPQNRQYILYYAPADLPS